MATPVREAFASLGNHLQIVYGYDPSTPNPWKSYSPSTPPFANQLQEVEPLGGYFVFVDQDVDFTVGPLSKRLRAGWNLVGWPGVAVPTGTPSPIPTARVISAPPAGQIYHGVFAPPAEATDEDEITLDGLRSYEQSVGKSAAWVYFSHIWYRGRGFPIETANWIRNVGSVPFIRLMLRSSSVQNIAEPTFTLSRILNGEFDSDLRAWARAARDFGYPLLAEYGVEVNGRWFSWNGVWNGGGTLDGYGDPALADGPERFRDAYRRIIGIARGEGADNILWVFHANNRDVPDESWNRLEQYYPGDEWIDWIGVSVYGAQIPTEQEWPQFRDLMDAVYPRLASLSPSKPIALLEFAVTAGNPQGDQAAWADSALRDLTALRWPRIIGFSWWNDHWPNDDDPAHNTNMRVLDNPALANVFRRWVGIQGNVLGRPILANRAVP